MIASEYERAEIVRSQGRDPIAWERETAIAYRKAWAHPVLFGMYKRALVLAYKRCRIVERKLRA